MTWEEYADLEGINATVLKEGRRSAKHLKHALEHAKEDTIRLGLGRATHCLTLTPELFEADFAIWEEGDRRGKAWLAFKEEHATQTIIKANEYEACVGMRDALLAHRVAGPLLRKAGEAEKVLRWKDEQTGLACKARLDKLTDDDLLDLKTSEDADARRFGLLAFRYGYHIQGAFYRMGVEAVLQRKPAVKLVVVEPEPPHDVAVFSVSDDDLYAGEEEARELLAKVSAGMFSGLWPGRYEEAEVPLQLPRWAFPEVEGLGITIGGEEG